MKKALRIFLLFLLAPFVFCCEQEQELLPTRVRIHHPPAGAETYEGAEVYLGDLRVPLFGVKVNTSQVWTPDAYRRTENGIAYFELDGRVKVTVKVPYELNYKSKVRPLDFGIIPVADLEKGTLTFEIDSPGTYVLEINGDLEKTLYFFVSAFEEEAFLPGEGENYLYFGPGLHTKENNDLIDDNNQVRLASNTTVFLAPGAVVRGKFHARNAENLKILGTGIISGSSFERNARTGTATIPIEFNHCRNVLLSDFSILDPAGWAVNFYFTEDSEINDLKIITSRSNGDGISIQSCKNILVNGCFVRSWDDSLVVKNYPLWEDRSVQGSTENIVFRNCILWTDLAQSMEIGYETVGKVMRNIVFENITVLHNLHKPVFSIHNGNNAEIEGVHYENITVEDASMGGGDAHGNDELIDFRVLYSATWSSQHVMTSLGSIRDVVVKNVVVLAGRKEAKIRISGCFDEREGFKSKHYVTGVEIINLTYKNQFIDESHPLLLGNYVNDVTVRHEGIVRGAEITKNTPQGYGEDLVVFESIYD